MDRADLGLKLKNWRLTSGKSIDDCAQALGILPDRMDSYESGIAWISKAEFTHLAIFLKIPVDELERAQATVSSALPKS